MTITLTRPVTTKLISPRLSARLIADVRKIRPGMTDDEGERGVYAMLGYLTACATTTAPLAPSKAVDDFWHAFVLRTTDYAVFSNRLAGRFLHHVPDGEPDGDEDDKDMHTLGRTLAAVKAAGFHIDPAFWPINAAGDCSQCHAGCTDSPVGGK
ncbi:hypothetical protein AB0C89_27905 [Streptomyces sp. NPDC048491]|uniref:glycine-rich domain-containing protein n=1 Tax=unclassified Streptomyces TaxID=2593676 RepID=UPI0034300FBE